MYYFDERLVGDKYVVNSSCHTWVPGTDKIHVHDTSLFEGWHHAKYHYRINVIILISLSKFI